MKLIKKLLFISFVQLLFVSVLSAGSISGKITLVSSAGIVVGAEGAEVFAYNTTSSTDSSVFTASTDSDGNYLFENLPAGEYGLFTQLRNMYGKYTAPISLGENEDLTGIDISLSDDGILGYDNQVSGVVKSSDSKSPLDGVEIVLYEDVPDSAAYLMSYSVADGSFIIQDIKPGNYRVSAYKYGFAKYSSNSIITVAENSKITGVEVVLTPLASDASLSGTVTNSVTSQPVKDVKIFIYGDGIVIPIDAKNQGIITTDKDGKYKIDNLMSGKYWYFTEIDGYESIWGEVDVNGATTLDIVIKQLVSGTIEGIVLDADGNPVKGTFVDFIPADKENYNYSYAVTNAYGKYSAQVGVGSYYVVCYANGLDSLFIGNKPSDLVPIKMFYKNALKIEDATIVKVQENQTTTDIDFTIPAEKEIEVVVTGSVKDDKGNGIEGATVELWQDNYFYTCQDNSPVGNLAKTDADGNYSLTVSQKSYSTISFTLLAYKDDYAVEYYNEKSEWYLADVLEASESGTKSDINFTLTEKSVVFANSISGQVTNESGKGLENVFVAAYSNSGYGYEEAKTDENGNYKITNLKNEDYIVGFFSLDNYIPELYDNVFTWEEATAVKANGDVTGIDVVLTEGEISVWDSSKTILGNVSDEAGNPLANVVVILKNSEGNAVASARTDAKGNYSCATSSRMVGEAIASRVGYVSTVKSLDEISPVANTVLLNLSLCKTVTAVDNQKNKNVPSEFTLQQNYPNPFNPSTTINFSLPTSQNVKLEVFNMLGETVATLINKPMSAGNHKYEFNASNINSGLYLYRITAGSFVEIKKMMLLK